MRPKSDSRSGTHTECQEVKINDNHGCGKSKRGLSGGEQRSRGNIVSGRDRWDQEPRECAERTHVHGYQQGDMCQDE